MDDPYKRWQFFNDDPSIRLSCEETPRQTIEQDAEISPAILIMREPPTYPAPKVGKFDLMPVYLGGEKANKVLFTNIQRIILDNGYSVVDEGHADAVIFEATMTMLWVNTKRPYAVVAFVVVVDTASETRLWDGVFTGRDEYELRQPRYHVVDAEAALARAYCRSLESFAQAVNSPDFIKATQYE